MNDDLRQLAEDARVLAEAELAYQKSRAAYARAQVPKIAIMAVVAGVFAFFTVMAAIFGLTFALTPLLGPWGAMAVVTGALLILTIVFAMIAKSRLGTFKRIALEKDRIR